MDHPLQPGWIDRPHRALALGDFRLESGETIRDFTLSWVMHGEPDAARSNVVLGVTAIGSTHHRLDFLIGPGRALDIDRYCIVVADAIGNGLTTSPSNSAHQKGTSFPRFTIRDMVESQRRLVESLGVARLYAVIGASMGGMQALQWAVSQPDAMARVVALVPMARSEPWSVAVNEASRRALMADPAWREGGGEAGWRAWTAVMQGLASRNPEAWRGAADGPGAVLAWLDTRTRAQVASGASALDWIWQTYAYDAHDVGSTPGHRGLETALASVRARTLIAAAPNDLYNPPEAARAAAALIPGARYADIPSPLGHSAGGPARAEDVAFLDRLVGAFLAEPA